MSEGPSSTMTPSLSAAGPSAVAATAASTGAQTYSFSTSTPVTALATSTANTTTAVAASSGFSSSAAASFFRKYSAWTGGGANTDPTATPLSSTAASRMTPTPDQNNVTETTVLLEETEDQLGETEANGTVPLETVVIDTAKRRSAFAASKTMGAASSLSSSSRATPAGSKGKKRRPGAVGNPSHPPPPSALAMSSASGREQQPAVQRQCQTHSFHTDAVEMQHMEKGLLKLLEDFNSGRLRAFGQGCSMEQMGQIRDQQENLAKMHFELGSRQDGGGANGTASAGGASDDSMDALMERLEKLSVAIGKLKPASANTATAALSPSSAASGNVTETATNGHAKPS